MELSYLMRIRIAAAMAIGILSVGLVGWHLVGPADPEAAFVLGTTSIGIIEIGACALLAFLAGLAAFFVSAPYGRHIGPVAVPAGLGIWGLRTAPMAALLQTCSTTAQRNAIYRSLAYEGFLWLGIIVCGLAAVYIAERMAGKKPAAADNDKTHMSLPYKYLQIPSAVIFSAIIAYVCMGMLAQDVKMADTNLGWVIGQPAVGQIAFAVIVAFGLGGFFSKAVLGAHYIWPTVSTAIVSLYIMVTCASDKNAAALTSNWPAAFFTNSSAAILPIQIVAFGALGALSGYWLGMRYLYWRKHRI